VRFAGRPALDGSSADTRKHNFQRDRQTAGREGSLRWPRYRVYIGWPTSASTRRAHGAHIRTRAHALTAGTPARAPVHRPARVSRPAGRPVGRSLARNGGGGGGVVGGSHGENIVQRLMSATR